MIEYIVVNDDLWWLETWNVVRAYTNVIPQKI